MIRFNIPTYVGDEISYIQKAVDSGRLSGGNTFSQKVQDWFKKQLNSEETLLTPSCTHALEMCAILLDIKDGDEVIMPSYTFVSTATAFALRGAKIVFVDIHPDTMNIDETKIEAAITSKTKAIVVVHYAGVACEMDTIINIANQYNLFVIEDAAQGMMSSYKGKALGTIGHLGTFSFHETKNYTSGGEGGLLIINDKSFIQRAEIIREKGTNRSSFFRGMIDKYSWVDIGSSYLMNEISAAYLFAQLNKATLINEDRLNSWHRYYNAFRSLVSKGYITLPYIPSYAKHNAHMFYLKVSGLEERNRLISYLKDNGIVAVFHYIPLHSSLAGKKFGTFHNKDVFTTIESEKLIRLPLYFGLSNTDIDYIIKVVYEFFETN